MVEPQSSNLITRVRFSSPAPRPFAGQSGCGYHCRPGRSPADRVSCHCRATSVHAVPTGPVRKGAPVFFFHDTPTTEIYTLSLHDALPISERALTDVGHGDLADALTRVESMRERARRSAEHTSELQSRQYLVCRLLLD